MLQLAERLVQKLDQAHEQTGLGMATLLDLAGQQYDAETIHVARELMRRRAYAIEHAPVAPPPPQPYSIPDRAPQRIAPPKGAFDQTRITLPPDRVPPPPPAPVPTPNPLITERNDRLERAAIERSRSRSWRGDRKLADEAREMSLTRDQRLARCAAWYRGDEGYNRDQREWLAQNERKGR